jgi:hypothetical protein
MQFPLVSAWKVRHGVREIVVSALRENIDFEAMSTKNELSLLDRNK